MLSRYTKPVNLQLIDSNKGLAVVASALQNRAKAFELEDAEIDKKYFTILDNASKIEDTVQSEYVRQQAEKINAVRSNAKDGIVDANDYSNKMINLSRDIALDKTTQLAFVNQARLNKFRENLDATYKDPSKSKNISEVDRYLNTKQINDFLADTDVNKTFTGQVSFSTDLNTAATTEIKKIEAVQTEERDGYGGIKVTKGRQAVSIYSGVETVLSSPIHSETLRKNALYEAGLLQGDKEKQRVFTEKAIKGGTGYILKMTKELDKYALVGDANFNKTEADINLLPENERALARETLAIQRKEYDNILAEKRKAISEYEGNIEKLKSGGDVQGILERLAISSAVQEFKQNKIEEFGQQSLSYKADAALIGATNMRNSSLRLINTIVSGITKSEKEGFIDPIKMGKVKQDIQRYIEKGDLPSAIALATSASADPAYQNTYTDDKGKVIPFDEVKERRGAELAIQVATTKKKEGLELELKDDLKRIELGIKKPDGGSSGGRGGGSGGGFSAGSIGVESTVGVDGQPTSNPNSDLDETTTFDTPETAFAKKEELSTKVGQNVRSFLKEISIFQAQESKSFAKLQELIATHNKNNPKKQINLDNKVSKEEAEMMLDLLSNFEGGLSGGSDGMRNVNNYLSEIVNAQTQIYLIDSKLAGAEVKNVSNGSKAYNFIEGIFTDASLYEKNGRYYDRSKYIDNNGIISSKSINLGGIAPQVEGESEGTRNARIAYSRLITNVLKNPNATYLDDKGGAKSINGKVGSEGLIQSGELNINDYNLQKTRPISIDVEKDILTIELIPLKASDPARTIQMQINPRQAQEFSTMAGYQKSYAEIKRENAFSVDKSIEGTSDGRRLSQIGKGGGLKGNIAPLETRGEYPMFFSVNNIMLDGNNKHLYIGEVMVEGKSHPISTYSYDTMPTLIQNLYTLVAQNIAKKTGKTIQESYKDTPKAVRDMLKVNSLAGILREYVDLSGQIIKR